MDVDVALFGVPFDTGVTYRVGGRFGTGAVRDASVMLRPYNPNLEIAPFEHLSCIDYGDVAIVPGYIERSYAAIESAVGPIVEAGVIPLLIGGDHACIRPGRPDGIPRRQPRLRDAVARGAPAGRSGRQRRSLTGLRRRLSPPGAGAAPSRPDDHARTRSFVGS